MTEEIKEVEETEEGSILDNLNRRDFIKGAAAAVGGVLFSSSVATNLEAAAHNGQDYVIVSEVVKGSAGSVGPPCQLTSTFKKGEQIVWHAVLFSGSTGEKLNDHKELMDRGMKVQVELENGDTVDMHHSEHPPDESPKIYYWGGSWKISPGVPTGKMTYKIMAEDDEGRTGTLEMFGDKTVDTFPHVLTIEEK
ncbi:MAG: twin-arginine translocation signal domain-containing protein [Candidatus Bipolaricaulota bacterium]|nr:twin-arginine translocation signal domain-containing protein [Candidatus Bipolaricaulota bacterium]MBS3792306.1 twin-arginine translocation signal domain-containing protein [Candidatus Bipolaricaulota bacterium]